MKPESLMSRRVGLGLLGVLLLGAMAVTVMRSGVDAAARAGTNNRVETAREARFLTATNNGSRSLRSVQPRSSLVCASASASGMPKSTNVSPECSTMASWACTT